MGALVFCIFCWEIKVRLFAELCLFMLPQYISNMYSWWIVWSYFGESNFSDPRTSLLLQIEIAKTGALCCVAAGPHGEKSVKTGRDHSMDLIEPHWRTNSSFSPPPPSRIWDCRIQTDSLLNGPGDSVHGTSTSSNGKVSKRGLGSDRYTNHHHSVSDGILSYSGSPPDNVQVPQWTSPIQKINFDGFATPSIRGNLSLIFSLLNIEY